MITQAHKIEKMFILASTKCCKAAQLREIDEEFITCLAYQAVKGRQKPGSILRVYGIRIFLRPISSYLVENKSASTSIMDGTAASNNSMVFRVVKFVGSLEVQTYYELNLISGSY